MFMSVFLCVLPTEFNWNCLHEHGWVGGDHLLKQGVPPLKKVTTLTIPRETINCQSRLNKEWGLLSPSAFHKEISIGQLMLSLRGLVTNKCIC